VQGTRGGSRWQIGFPSSGSPMPAALFGPWLFGIRVKFTNSSQMITLGSFSVYDPLPHG
jgi:hypothetical protein